MTSSNNNGLTQKEMMVLMMDGQEKINDRIDLLHEKVNQKMSRQELSGWMVAVSAFVVIINQLMLQQPRKEVNFERNTFNHNKPDPRHLTDVVEIMQGDVSKTIMIGDSETDADAAHAAKIPFILVKDGYTEKTTDQIHHDHLISEFIGIEKIISKYLPH